MQLLTDLAAERRLTYAVAYRRALAGEFGRLVRVGKRWYVAPAHEAEAHEPVALPPVLADLLAHGERFVAQLRNWAALRGPRGTDLSWDEIDALGEFAEVFGDTVLGLEARLLAYRRAAVDASGARAKAVACN